MAEPNYYANGLRVFQRPVGGGMGFPICDANEFVDGAAEVIANALNFVDKVAAFDAGGAEIAGLIAEARRIGDT